MAADCTKKSIFVLGKALPGVKGVGSQMLRSTGSSMEFSFGAMSSGAKLTKRWQTRGASSEQTRSAHHRTSQSFFNFFAFLFTVVLQTDLVIHFLVTIVLIKSHGKKTATQGMVRISGVRSFCQCDFSVVSVIKILCFPAFSHCGFVFLASVLALG